MKHGGTAVGLTRTEASVGMADFPRLLPDLPKACLKSLDTDPVGAWYEVNVLSG